MKKTISVLLAVLLVFMLPASVFSAVNAKGDIDGDLAVDVPDARGALRQAVGLENLSARDRSTADVDGDGEVTVADARMILRIAVGLTDYAAEEARAVEEKLASMSTQEKIAQMIMVSIRNFGGREVTAINDSIAGMLARYPYAGVILFAPNTQSAEQTLRLTDALQKANGITGRARLLIAVDQEGGKITRLATGTQTPGNMALGAIGDESAARSASGIIGAELSSLGINVDFAPVMDVNNNPANPVIGVRSFSDDPALAAKMGGAYINGLQDENVISALKHFPGHGDTGTDSHTGLPLINKTYAQLKECELVPFAKGIAEGAEMIMTAHIQFPQIEKATYGRIPLPATLSKTMITDILRRDMGYDGVVITDALNMGAIADYFDPLDAAVLAINAGVDILLMPVTVDSDSGVAAQENYIRSLAAKAENGSVSMEAVNAAVRRILRLKYRKGLFAQYQAPDLSAAIAAANATVGSDAHHETEWELAKRAVTMVKNSNNTLPIRGQNKKIVLLAAYDNEVLSMQYGAERLRAEGGLPAGARIVTDLRTPSDTDRLISVVRDADYVIAISELYRASALDPRTSSGASNAELDRIINAVHRYGGKFILVSANLPYDAARFQSADAILLCWSDKGMSEDPRVAGGEVTQYGPNIPAAVYVALSQTCGPQGKLPVNIPKLTSGYDYSSEILYRRGTGLTY